MKVVSAVAVVVAVVAAMAGFVYLSVKGIDTTAFVAFTAAVLLPQAVQMFQQDKTRSSQVETQKDVAIIKERTNGPLDRQAETLVKILNKLHSVDERLTHLEGRDDNAGSS